MTNEAVLERGRKWEFICQENSSAGCWQILPGKKSLAMAPTRRRMVVVGGRSPSSLFIRRRSDRLFKVALVNGK